MELLAGDYTKVGVGQGEAGRRRSDGGQLTDSSNCLSAQRYSCHRHSLPGEWDIPLPEKNDGLFGGRTAGAEGCVLSRTCCGGC